MRSLRLPLLSVALLTLATHPLLLAQTQDAAPVDTVSLLKELHRLRDQQNLESNKSRQSALKDVISAANNPERAILLWEEAIRVVQFSGAPKENSVFRDWKEKEGDAFNAPLVRNAARLYFMWLSLTIQRDGGTPVKDLLPQVLAYTKELVTQDQAVSALEDMIKQEKEAPKPAKPVPPPPVGVHHKATHDQIKKMHDTIFRRPIDGSPVVQWLRLKDFINAEGWEKQPSNFDGIYNSIILPEFRLNRDPKALEYWDLKYNREAEVAARTKLAFEVEKFTTLRRPVLMWSRAEEMLAIGHKNRALTEMLSVIRANPLHPEAANWVVKLEQLLAPPVAPEDGTVPPPVPAK